MDLTLLRLVTASGLLALASACESHAAGGAPVDAADSSMEASCGDAGSDVTLAPLVTEAGFIAIPPQPTAARYAARMFYDFQPADTDPESKPLFVLFNGGPGFATSSCLLVRGTGRMTLPVQYHVDVEPVVDGGASVPVPNPSSWTRFANLLYLDERLVGFSYGIEPSVKCVMSPVEDASDFVRALLTFLDSHPALRGNQVVLVGESYGGVRASWMLDMLLRYPTEAAKGGSDLPGLIQAHYDAVFPCAGGAVGESTAARQFGSQVLIEPLVLGDGQGREQDLLMPEDPYVGSFDLCDMDQNDVLEPPGWSDGLTIEAMQALSDPSAAKSLLGVALDAIALLGPSARADAFRGSDMIVGGPAPDAGPLDAPDASPPPITSCPNFPPNPLPDATQVADARFAALLGPLKSRDGYYMPWASQCDSEDGTGDTSQPFMANLRYVKTFITHARYDATIYAPAIPGLLAYRGFGGTVDSAQRPGVARPGWFNVNLPASPSQPPLTVEVRFPPYDKAGHEVSSSQPDELASDVQAWMRGE